MLGVAYNSKAVLNGDATLSSVQYHWQINATRTASMINADAILNLHNNPSYNSGANKVQIAMDV